MGDPRGQTQTPPPATPPPFGNRRSFFAAWRRSVGYSPILSKIWSKTWSRKGLGNLKIRAPKAQGHSDTTENTPTQTTPQRTQHTEHTTHQKQHRNNTPPHRTTETRSISHHSRAHIYKNVSLEEKWWKIRSRRGLGNLEIRPRATPRPAKTVTLEEGHRFDRSLGRGMAKFDVSWPFSGPNFRPKTHFEDKSEQFHELGRDF